MTRQAVNADSFQWNLIREMLSTTNDKRSSISHASVPSAVSTAKFLIYFVFICFRTVVANKGVDEYLLNPGRSLIRRRKISVPSLKRKHSRETETKKPCISETELYRDLNFWLFPFYLYILQCRSESETMTYRRRLSWHWMTLWPHHTELTKNGQLPLA